MIKLAKTGHQFKCLSISIYSENLDINSKALVLVRNVSLRRPLTNMFTLLKE